MTDTTALQALTARIDATPASIECGAGWHDLIDELDATLAAIDPHYVLLYVGRDRGRLVYEARPSSDVCDRRQFEKAIRSARSASTMTCEVCGRLGRTRRIDGLTETLCDPHRAAASRQARPCASVAHTSRQGSRALRRCTRT